MSATEQWLQLYFNGCERGFYDQDNAPEVTIPQGTELYWLDDPKTEGVLDRPEMDLKDALRHPEVYPDGGRFSGYGFFQNTTGRAFLITERIYLQVGRPVRGHCQYMQALRGTQGGGRLGIVDGDGPFDGQHARPPSDEAPIDACAVWSSWVPWTTEDNVWRHLYTPPILPTVGFVRLVLRFNVDYATWGGFGYDRLTIEQIADSGPGPDPKPTPDLDALVSAIRQVIRDELDSTHLTRTKWGG